MAFVAVTSLMRSLEFQFLHPQPRVSLSNKKLIESLHEKLGLLLVFLDKFENSADNFPEIRDVTEEIIDVTVKADDDIEADLLNVYHHPHLDETSFPQLDEASFPEFYRTLQRVVDDVEAELMQITMKTSDLIINSTLMAGGSSQSQHTSHVDVDVVHEADAMVGHSEELDEVMIKLLGGTNKRHQVMAVVGMGGIGKTTFAKRIYDDPRVKYHFDLCAWTTMSQEYNKEQAILELCRCVKPSSSAFNNKMKGELEGQLRKSLLGHRYLIIVDDIWTTEAWDDIHRCFPDDNNNIGSKILLTTRSTDVAQYASSGEYSYKMRQLNAHECWGLFCHKFLDKELFQKDAAFRTIGMKIVEKCGGLPLTVVVMAGLLSKTDKSIDEWEKVEKNLKDSRLAVDLDDQFSRIFTLSYNHLPSHLKGCFLYLRVFHEDSEIPVKKLIRLWIAEGFVETMSHRKRAEEVGRDYLQDLIDRSLVMVNERSFDGEIKTCRMHDLLHECARARLKARTFCTLKLRVAKIVSVALFD